MTAYIAGYARTPFTKFTGQLATETAVDLGAHAVSAALERAGISADKVDQVIAGQVLQAGAGQNPARQTAVGAGVGFNKPAQTLNVVCLSGTEAISQANRLINAGEAEVVVAVGQESMSQAPHVAPLRSATKYGAANFQDTVDHDGLTDAFERIAMGTLTDQGNTQLGLNRCDQDAYAAQSHQRAAAHQAFLADEIAPYTVKTRRGETVIEHDDGVRGDATAESLANLRPAFNPDGTVTAGNASQITDGAAAVVVVSEAAVERMGLKPLARIESTAFVAGPDVQLHSQPANAIRCALEKAGYDTAELKVVEINEAFASVSLQSAKELGIDLDLVNPRGGAIALGHPIGASGTRIVGTLARQLAEAGAGSVGAAGICGGGGQGSAIILRAV
ncbi:acetyl-CoA C-acyltransferase [Enteractinococcus helveticum]|uniref:Probable acetyl-CoA acetyltransferase n=1 Tax=Enteractinococcus helveticum TaxID=1837282 RepID=A0A1B7M0G6_9MICC|nr:acetyl-CoA C-acyltransferase [Enteractinococcus helveticum]OAV61514.1 acetyl-CoA acetyltransferase [Enteractinococcus helveticum]